eukprot:9841583-Karenia_brevis.AAC.1
MPSLAGKCSLLDSLPAEESQDLRKFEERLLLSSEELSERIIDEGPAKACWDPVLKYDMSSYVEFVTTLHERGMIRYSLQSKEKVGVFCVAKKNGKLRLIVDCRCVNQRLRLPPKTRLASCAAFCEVHIPS